MTLIRAVRWASTCSKFSPLHDSYSTLRHIHFPGITDFSVGERIQQHMVNANLDFKKMDGKIRKQQKALESQGFAVNEYEEKVLQQVLELKPLPTVLTFEFDHVYTGGKQMKQDPELPGKIKQFEKAGCQYHQLERGGQVTWHGPGQVTAYIVMDLKAISGLTVKCYVDSVLLKAVQNVLERHGVPSFTNENPGVWAAPNDLKIASVGCNIQRAITSYGVGLNIDPDLSFLNKFTMCGLPSATATSLKHQNPTSLLSVADAGRELASEIARLLGMSRVDHMDGTELTNNITSP